MTVDLRKFAYALEPVRRKHRWQFDASLAKLGKAQVAVDEAERSLQQLRDGYTQAARDAGAAQTGRFDPGMHRRSVAYLGQVQRQIDLQKERLQELQEERGRLRAECVVLQQKLELTERHRQQSLDEYVLAEQNRQSAEADRDWVARSLWRASGMQEMTK
jgi:hypothetical protein